MSEDMLTIQGQCWIVSKILAAKACVFALTKIYLRLVIS